jgi:undecaprenyl-diphosphatase
VATRETSGEREREASGRFARREVLLALALALVSVPFGLLVHQVVRDGPLTDLDERSARWLHERALDHEPVVTGMRVVSALGSAAFLTAVVTAAVLWLLRSRQHRLALFLAVVCAGGGLISTIVKVAVGRPRPELDEPVATAFGKSFPSGHSMSSLVCFGALLVVFLPFVPRAWRQATVAITAGLVVAVGLSRMVLGVHFLSDVLGGYVLGTAWLVGSVALFETWRIERGRRPTQPLEQGIEPEAARTAQS